MRGKIISIYNGTWSETSNKALQMEIRNNPITRKLSLDDDGGSAQVRVRFIFSWRKASSDLCKHPKVYEKPVQCTSDSGGDDDGDDESNNLHEIYVYIIQCQLECFNWMYKDLGCDLVQVSLKRENLNIQTIQIKI